MSAAEPRTPSDDPRPRTLFDGPRPRTLFDKVWDSHVVDRLEDGTCVLYIDRHHVHEVTSPQAFEGLRLSGRRVRRPDATIAVVDHNIPTSDRRQGIAEPESRLQVETLERNVAEFGVPYFPVLDDRQGIVHIIGPEQGISLPGMTIVCGDSHTSTHGAMGALAFGIGTSEVEHVLATQTLLQKKSKNMVVEANGALPFGTSAKDLVLAIIGCAASDARGAPPLSSTPTGRGRWAIVGVSSTSTSSKSRLALAATFSPARIARRITAGRTQLPSRYVSRVRFSSRS